MVMRTSEVTNIYMKCVGLTQEEKEELMKTIRKISKKRKHNTGKRLLYYIDMREKAKYKISLSKWLFTKLTEKMSNLCF